MLACPAKTKNSNWNSVNEGIMTNRLAGESSPYLLQHADNPVDWYPWGGEALERAHNEDKPIFLSIGYAACHWCHVMAHESFEDPATAALMNEQFINIKVDREERPDLDGIYMQAVTAMTGQGGWPMSVFLTPEGKPFYGGTYFPPVRRYNMPSFTEVLQTIARLWQQDRPRLLQSSEQIAAYLDEHSTSLGQESIPFDPDNVKQALVNLAQSYDWQNGGWGKAPKFPQPMVIEFLLRSATRGDAEARDIAIHALEAMARGGMYDLVGGGFARYSTDDRWLVPHFEKMLYDNAQLARVYLHGWLVSGEAQFRQVCEETLDFVARELTDPLGGFYSSLDADSEGEEGKFYLWTPDEIQAVLEDPQDFALVCAAYQVNDAGNFEGKTIFQRQLTDAQLAERFRIDPETVAARLKEAHQKLLSARSKRIPPGTDDKVLTSWNALMLHAYAEAGRYLGRADYLEIAQRNAQFLLENLAVDGRLLRSWRKGQANHNAYLEDYAALILGLLALYQSDGEVAWYRTANWLADEMIAHFSDPGGGFFDTRDDHETLLYRPKDLQDNATPSGNALAACALLQMAAYQGRSDWRGLAEAMLASLQGLMARYPTAFACWLHAADFSLGPVSEVVLIGDGDHPVFQALRQELWKHDFSRLVTALSPDPAAPGSPALLQDRPLLNGLPTAYVCQGFVCQQPTNSPEELNEQLTGRITG
jgi:hypothetical protein